MNPRADDAPTTVEWLRDAVDRLGRGSGRLVVLIGRRAVQTCRTCWARGSVWLDDATGLSWMVRAAVLAGGALVAARIGTAVLAGSGRRIEAARWLMWPTTAVWLTAAYRVGRPDWRPKASPAPDSPADAEEPDAEAAPDGVQDDDGTAAREAAPAAAPMPTRRQLAVALHRLGAPHCHTAVLAAALGISQDRAREALAAAGVPTGPVRMRGRGSSTGVRAADFPPLPAAEERPPDGVVAAGERANNDNNNVAEYYLAPDRFHPHLTHVVWEGPSTLPPTTGR
ncbi:hypothetical protein [Wenjunlia vitaminophila]|uniref:hypothetical protein n=1 Tax=Wenjunlia vitaminophila TaxID=76728 RepID=UPI000369FD02|nr:hypothetical protein [Wenjunlia vitaminophila]